MYIGGLRTTWDSDGVIVTEVASAVQDRLDDWGAALIALDPWRPVIVRKINGVGHQDDIGSFSLAPTISFLRRRYR